MVLQARVELTLAVCTNKPNLLKRHWRRVHGELAATDRLLVVLDVCGSPDVDEFAAAMRRDGAMVIVNGSTLGLSRSRNTALLACESEHIVFIDDDVILTSETLSGIRSAFHDGYGIVGVRIHGPENRTRLPWYITDGQFHYLGIHNERVSTTWGACMAMSIREVRARQLKFRTDLGRHGTKLSSGEDTSFLRSLRDSGVREIFLRDVYVNHNIDNARYAFSYMARRAFWQGRTELLRDSAKDGLRKELGRNWDAQATLPRRLLLTGFYGACVLSGIVFEWLASRFGT